MLSLLVPAVTYFSMGGNRLSEFSTQSTQSAAKLEQIANDIESGKISHTRDSLVAYVRMQANSERTLSSMYENLADAAHSFFVASAGIALLQAGLLAWVFKRRSGIEE
jgi:hypothetical protein